MFKKTDFFSFLFESLCENVYKNDLCGIFYVKNVLKYFISLLPDSVVHLVKNGMP